MKTDVDVTIVGGGLAGLAASILLRRGGHSVALFEKEQYPFHKVCGEYISLESWDFLQSLGVPLTSLQLPRIDTLQLTAPGGRELHTRLPLGGFGISRYRLDKLLFDLAIAAGVRIYQKTKVDDISWTGESTLVVAGATSITTKICCGAFGKRSNLDVRWKREFVTANNTRLNNYVGVKYHVRLPSTSNVIALHNFRNGYCGLSQIEEEKHCLCYLTKAENLKACGGSIDRLQREVLGRNPFLKEIFARAEVLPGFPVTISQISFQKKTKVENGVLMLGDAAGMITPLCGNGMSIALHTGKIAAMLINDFLQGKTSRAELEREYKEQWNQQFASRLRTGRFIQSFFGHEGLSNALVAAFQTFPFLAKPLIRMTHGKPF